MSQNYDYTIATAFPNAAVDSSRLTQEIQASAIVTALDYISTASGTCSIWFKAALSSGDETILDGLVAAHSGESLAQPPQAVTLSGVKQELDGRISVRTTAVITAKNFQLKVFSFVPGDPSSLHDKKVSGTSMVNANTVTMTCYDGSDTVTTDPASAVKTVLDYEPSWDYEVISGKLVTPEVIRTGTTEQWFVAVIAVPDIPAIYGGSIQFVTPVNLEVLGDGYVVSDGRAAKYLTYNATYHTNKIRWIFWHPTGSHPRFQIYVETFQQGA